MLRRCAALNDMEQITLSRGLDCWLATFTDPLVIEAFGSDTIPTAFTPSAPAELVLENIRRLNPGAAVLLAAGVIPE